MTQIVSRDAEVMFPMKKSVKLCMYTVTTKLELDWIQVFPEFTKFQDNRIYCAEEPGKQPYVFAIEKADHPDRCTLKPITTQIEAAIAEVEMQKLLELAKEDYVQRKQEAWEEVTSTDSDGLEPGWYKRRGSVEAYQFRQPLHSDQSSEDGR